MTFIEKQIVKIFNPGDVVFEEGEPGTSMFIIQKGLVDVFKITNGQKVVLATLKEGSIFGEMKCFHLLWEIPEAHQITPKKYWKRMPIIRSGFIAQA